MATQADIPEDVLHKKLELEDTSLTAVQFEKTVKEYFSVEVKKSESQLNESQEIQECQAESENKQAACSVQVEVTNNIVNGNTGTVEDESFLASPSGPTISNKEAGGREDRQVDEIKPSEMEVSETAKHLETGPKLEAVEETAREDQVIEKEKQKADHVDKSLGQNVEEILNQQDSVDEGSRSSEKETKDSEKDERAGEEEDSHTELSSKEISSVPEVTLGHKDVQSIAETCPKDENEDNTSSTEATFLKKEYTEEKIFEETKEEDKSIDLVLGGNGSESISSSDNKGAEDEKNQTHDNAGDASSSTAAPSCEESQNHETGENVKDEVERIALTDEPVDQEAGVTEKEKHELNRQEKDEAPTEHEMLDKDSSVTSSVAKAEEVCSSQEVDNPEILKVSSEIGSEHVAKEAPFEVTREIQILEETTQVKGTASGDVNTNERYEEGIDISPGNNEEDIHGKGEWRGITQAAEEEAQNTEGTDQVATEDISSVKLSQAEELTEVESIKHEDHPHDNLLPQNEPEEEKFQTRFNVVSEEIKSETLRGDDTTVIPVQEEGEIKSLDESFKEKEKKEEPIPSEEITNLPLTHSDGKTESREVEVPENDANNSNATHVLVEQAEIQGEKIDKVPELESHEKDQTSDEASAKEEKHVEVEPEGYQSTEKTIVTSTEGTAPTEIILKESENTKDAENDFGMSSKESFESRDAGENESEEIKKEAEVTDVDVQKFTPSQESEESSTLDDIPSKVDSTVREIPEEEASKPIVEDETQKQECIVADFNKEQISERDAAFSTPESVQEGTSKSSEDNVKDAEKLIEEESSTEIIDEGNINDLSLKNIQEDATETLKDHEHEAEKSKEEVLEELETVGAGESIPSETNKDAERIAEGSSVKQEEGQHKEGMYLDRTEASIEEESKVETPKEEPLKPRGEDEGHTEENAEGNVSKEQIIERDVTFSTPVSVQEETNKSSQDNIKDEENLNEEESIVEPKKEGKLDEDSPDNTREDATTALDREIEAEKSKEEIVEELEPSRAGESIPCETNKDVESLVDASSVKQEEEALEPKREDECHRQEAESNKEQITEEDVTFSAVESIQEETSITSQDNVKDAEKLNEEESTVQSLPENNQEDEIKKVNDHESEAEKCKEEVVQESEIAGPRESIPFETSKDVEEFVEALPIKQEESQQEEGKYQDPIKASIEENKVQTPNEDVPKSKGEDESRGQESTVADFDKEEIVGRDVTLSTPELIQEETNESSQDNFKDVDTIIEEHPAEVTKEGNIINLSRENVEEDGIEESKDNENEVEESKKEVVEELETAGPGENVPCETNKDVERSDHASSVKQEESKQEEVKYLEPTGASIEENKPEIPEEENSKSRVDDESQHENAGADFDNEKIVEREVTFCTPEPIQEEASKTSQDGLKDEESTTEITKEGEINNLSQENIQEDTIKTLKDHESEVEKFKEEVVEEFEKDVAGDSIPCETTKVDESSVDASSVKHEDSRQEESKYVDPNGASVENNEVEISEEEASKSRGEGESQGKESTGADFNKEQIVGEEVLSTLESIREETSKSSQDNIKDAEKVNEEMSVEITKEGGINDLSPENTEEDATEALKDHENEVEISKDEVVQELETAGPSKSIQYETNQDVESSDVSLVKQEESQQEEVTEIGAELASNGEEDQQHAMQKDKPEEKLEESFHVATQKTETEKSCEIARELTCIEVEGTIQNLNETSETEKEGDNSNNIDVTNDSEKEIPKEIETAGASESSSVDALSVKQEERQQEEAKDIDQVGSSTEKKTIEETLTAEVEKDDEENKASDASSKGEEGQQQATQKDEPDNKLENLLHEKPEETDQEKPKELEATEANESSSCKISEVAESYVDASSVTQEESQQEEVKYIDQIESSTEENKVEDKNSTEVVKEADDSKVEATEKKVEVELNDEEDQQHATQKDEPEEKLEDLLNVTPEEAETEPSTEIAREITSAEVEETARGLDKTSESENEEEKTKNKDVTNNSEKEILKDLETVGADAESSVDASSLKQEESPEEEIKYIDQAEASIEKTFTTEEVTDDYENKVSDVASKGEEDQQEATQKDEPEEKLENLLHVMPAETETETSTENARYITRVGEEGTAQNLEETSETEKKQHVDSTNDSEKEIPQELETAGIGESIPCKTNEELERSVVMQEEDKKLDQVEASKEENKVEDLSSTEVVAKEGDDNEVKVTEKEIEEDLQQAPQKDELRRKLEDVPQVAPEETKMETSSGNATNITCVEAEGTIQDVEETSETERKEENVKSTDNAIDSEKEVLENSSAGQETREEVSREISSVEEFSHKLSDTETTEETKEEIVKESSKEVEKEEDKSSESTEQIEEVGLIEETKPESLEDSAKPNEDICTTVTTEAPGEEKLAAKETQEKEPAAHDDSDSGSAGILAEETSEKEAEPDDKEEVKSHEVALEEKGLEVDQVQSESVVLTEIASEETGWKEVKTEHEEKIETSDDALEKKGLESSVDSVTREIVSEETCLKEAKPDDEEHIKCSDAASEEKGVSSSIDVGSESEYVSTGILSEKARLEEAEPDNEEQVKTCDVATEEKGLERSVDVDVQSDFASTRIESEEPSSKEAESETVEQVKSYDRTPEEKGLASKKDAEVLSESVSTEILSTEISVMEADQDSEDQVKHSDIAREDKSLPSSLDVELVKEAEADKEDDDNKVKVTEGEIEEDLQQAPQQEKPEEKLEDVLQVTPKETEKERSSGNVTSLEGEGAIQDVEKTSETENKEQNTKNTDNANDSVKEGLETTSGGPETREEVSRDIGSLEEFSHKSPDTETTEETNEEGVEGSSTEVEKEEDKSSESKELNDEVGLIEELKPESLEDSAKPNEEETKEEIIEESSKEIEKEEDKSSESKEQIEEVGFIEEIKPDSLEDSAKPNEDICTTVATEAPEEEKLAAKETQEKEPAAHDGSDSRSAGILGDETSVKEAEPDDKEEVKSQEVSLEEKGLKVDQVQSESVVLTEIASEETGWKEVKTEHEEKIETSDDALEKKGLESSVDSVTREIASEETCLKEAKPDNEEQIKSSDAASEEKGVSSSIYVGSESESVSTGILSEEARLEEAEPDNEEQVKTYDIATEEKGLERSVDVDLQSDFASTGVESEERSSKEDESETVEQVKSCEENGLDSKKETELQSESVSTEILSSQTRVEEANEDREDQVKHFDIAPEGKTYASSLDTEIVNEETSLKEAVADNEEHVESGDFALDKEDLVSDTKVEVQSASVSAETISEETGVKEVQRDHEEQVSSSNVAFEETSQESSVDDTRIVSEETSSKEVQPDDEEQVKDIASEKESLVTGVDTKKQPDVVSAGIESEGTCLKEDKPENDDEIGSSDIASQELSLVSEETSFKEAELDTKEEVKTSYVASKEEDVASNVNEQQNEYAESEVNEEKKVPEVTGEFEGKIEQEIKAETPIAGTENKEHDTKADTSLEGSSGDILKDSSAVPSKNDEPVTTEERERSNEEIQKQRDVEITTKDAIPTKGHDVEKDVENESSNEHVTDKEINLNESHPVSIVDERVHKKNDSGPIVTEEVKIEEERTVTNLEETQPLETNSEERNLVSQKYEHDISQAEEVESVTKLEERSIDLDQVDEKETEAKTIAEETSDVNEVKETKLISGTEDVDVTRPIPAVEKPETVESKEEIKEVSECQSVKAKNEDEITSEQAPGDGISKGQGLETETIVETEEETIKDVDHQDNENVEASSAVTHLETEEPSGPKLHEAAEERLQKEETEEDTKIVPEPLFESSYESIQAVSKDGVTVDRDRHVGVSTEQVQELQTTEVVKKTEDSLVAEKAEEKNLKEETEEEITEAPITVSIEDQALPAVSLKDELQVSHPEEQNSEKTSHSSATKTTEEECLPKEEPREIKASDSLTDVSGSNETQEETKDASKTVFESDSQSIVIVTEDKKVTCETFPENSSEVQLLEQSYVLLPKEQEDVVTTTAKEIDEKTTEETFTQKEVEDIIEASETVSKENSPGTEVVGRDTYTDRALPVDKYEIITDQALKVPSYSTTVSDEQVHDTAATDKKSEEKETEGESCVVKTVEEPKKIEVSEPKKIEPQESEGGKRDTDSQSEHDEVSETREAVEKREMASELVTEKVDSPEAFTSIEEVEIIENHLKVATTDSRTEEPQGETTIQAEKTTEKENADKQELSREISEEKGGLALDIKEVQETESSHAKCKESLETRTATSDKEAPPKLTNPVEDETSLTAEPKDAKPEKVTSVSREIIADVEIKKEECEEKETGGSKTETKPAVVSLSELMQSSIEETARVAEHSAEAEKAKTDEEEEEEEDDEHEREREEAEHPDAPILVQAFKEDSDHKGGRKKSHGLFSGVGSKVKHSISKVKKAITGKSSHSKTLPST